MNGLECFQVGSDSLTNRTQYVGVGSDLFVNGEAEQRYRVVECSERQDNRLLAFGVVKVVEDRIGVVLKLQLGQTRQQTRELRLEPTEILSVPGADKDSFRTHAELRDEYSQLTLLRYG